MKTLFVLELFHGPTLAFKDFALQLLGNLYEEQIRGRANRSTCSARPRATPAPPPFTACSGKEGVNIFILYPDGRVSPLQERQMACTGAANVFTLASRRLVRRRPGDREGNCLATTLPRGVYPWPR
jgi:threonine synthase